MSEENIEKIRNTLADVPPGSPVQDERAPRRQGDRTHGNEPVAQSNPAQRQLEVGEDGAPDRRILDGGDDAQAAATAGTGEGIKTERPAHPTPPRSTRTWRRLNGPRA